jgi:uncharacterized cupredoxin-like copper-binding protein
MKIKNILTAMIMLASVSFSASALELNEYKVFNRLNNESTQKSLAVYLQTSESQAEMLKTVFEKTGEKMKYAIENENEVAAEKAMWFNLANAKSILTPAQYKKYLVALNLTIHSRNYEVLAEK